MAEPIDDYGQRGIDYWSQGGVPSPVRSGGPHARQFCPCLSCADARQAMGYRPLTPLFGLEAKLRLTRVQAAGTDPRVIRAARTIATFP